MLTDNKLSEESQMSRQSPYDMGKYRRRGRGESHVPTGKLSSRGEDLSTTTCEFPCNPDTTTVVNELGVNDATENFPNEDGPVWWEREVADASQSTLAQVDTIYINELYLRGCTLESKQMEQENTIDRTVGSRSDAALSFDGASASVTANTISTSSASVAASMSASAPAFPCAHVGETTSDSDRFPENNDCEKSKSSRRSRTVSSSSARISHKVKRKVTDTLNEAVGSSKQCRKISRNENTSKRSSDKASGDENEDKCYKSYIDSFVSTIKGLAKYSSPEEREEATGSWITLRRLLPNGIGQNIMELLGYPPDIEVKKHKKDKQHSFKEFASDQCERFADEMYKMRQLSIDKKDDYPNHKLLSVLEQHNLRKPEQRCQPAITLAQLDACKVTVLYHIYDVGVSNGTRSLLESMDGKNAMDMYVAWATSNSSEDLHTLVKSLSDLNNTRIRLDSLYETSSGSKRKVMHSLASEGHLDLISQLHDKFGMTLRVTTATGVTPLHISAARGYVKLTESILARDPEMVNIKDSQGVKLFHCAVERFPMSALEELNSKFGAEVDISTNQGITPLHIACWKGNNYVVKYLLDKLQVWPWARTTKLVQPIHYAAANGHVAVLLTLCDHGVDINCGDVNDVTPLHYAALNGHLNVVEELTKRPSIANYAKLTKNGYTALHLAAEKGHKDIVCHLLRVDNTLLEKLTVKGASALLLACLRDQQTVVELLLRQEADPNVRDKFGNTCMHMAAKKGHFKIAQMLMNDTRINLFIRNSKGRTPADEADTCNHEQVCDYLRRSMYGSDMMELTNRLKEQCRDVEIPHEYLCPITCDILLRPVVAADGFTYDHHAISRWLSCCDTSPQTNLKLDNTRLEDNECLMNEIKNWIRCKLHKET